MLWPLLVEYTEPGVPITSHLQQQGNMALFLTLFIVTCVEVLIVKVAQSERELEMMLTPHDPPFLSEYADNDEDDDICRVQANFYEEEIKRKKRFLINNTHLAGTDVVGLPEARTENDFENTLDENDFQDKIVHQSAAENATQWSENQKLLEAPKKQEPNTNTVKVRELIEKMVETIIGGPLDGTTVGQLSTHPTYLDMFTKYHNLLCRELAKLGFALHLSVVRSDSFEPSYTDLKHSNLKRLIKRILSEAIALPNIKEILSRPKTSKETDNEDFENKSYEDILATAILNKIIENTQNKYDKESQTFDRNPKPRLRNKKRKNRTDDIDFDGDWSDTSRSDQLSLTIEEYIEEITTALEVSDNEDSYLSDFEKTSSRRISFPESGKMVIDGTDDENSDLEQQSIATELITSTNSWEENWLFQKKRLRSTPNAHHPVPVPMLVPNPSEDFRALVGGVDADQLSDMSDCSDLILEDLATVEEPSSEQLNKECKTPHNFNSDEESKMGKVKQIQNIIKEESFCESKQEEIFNTRISAKEYNCDGAFTKDKNCSIQDTVQDDEKKLISSTLSEVLSQKDRDSSIENFSHQYESEDHNSAPEGSIKISTETEDFNRRCSMAEKEKEKWNNPVSLTDNPYSLENIEKREQRKKNDFFRIRTYSGELITFPNDIPSGELFEKETLKLRFSRDYYVNASKNPSGISSPSLNQNPKETEQVSRHSYDDFSTLDSRSLDKNSTFKLYTDIVDGSAKYFTLHPPLQNHTVRRQHFSQVFKTSINLDDDLPETRPYRKYKNGSHSLKLKHKLKETTYKKPFYEQELSDFEQNSLRDDLRHSLLRARGASPNFILNPVFKPDAVTKSNTIERKKEVSPLLYDSNEDDFKNGSSDEESDFLKSDPSNVFCHRKVGENTSRAYKALNRVSQESGYGSDSLEHSSDSLEFWRLTPPKTPEVVESSFVSMELTLPKKEYKFVVKEMQSETNEETTRGQIIDKSQFHLPNVKELAKQFAMDGNRESQRPNSELQTKSESKHNTRSVSNELPEKELEIDYSTIPVSEIILTLQQTAEAPAAENHLKHNLYDCTQPTTRMEIFRKVDNNLITENPTENLKNTEKTEPLRFNGKQVHSLTARSISKEFREGLKNSQKVSYQVFSRTDKISSGGESDQGDIICNKTKTPPTPTINLKNMKKFWEEIITANSNSSKQK